MAVSDSQEGTRLLGRRIAATGGDLIAGSLRRIHWTGVDL